jgi:hypothetical protein
MALLVERIKIEANGKKIMRRTIADEIARFLEGIRQESADLYSYYFINPMPSKFESVNSCDDDVDLRFQLGKLTPEQQQLISTSWIL